MRHFVQNASKPEKRGSLLAAGSFRMHVMKTSWQKCLKPEAAQKRRPKICISLNRRGDIALNAAAWNALGRCWCVVLLFDAAARRIGLQPVNPGEANAFTLRRTRSLGAKVIRAARLMKQFGIEIAETIRFPAPEVEGRVLVLDLGSAIVPDKVRKHFRNRRRALENNRRENDKERLDNI